MSSEAPDFVSSPPPLDTIISTLSSYVPEIITIPSHEPEKTHDFTYQPGKHRRIPPLTTSLPQVEAPRPVLSSEAVVAVVPATTHQVTTTTSPPPKRNKKWLMGIIITTVILAVVVAVNVFIYFYNGLNKPLQPQSQSVLLPKPSFSALMPATTKQQQSSPPVPVSGFRVATVTPQRKQQPPIYQGSKSHQSPVLIQTRRQQHAATSTTPTISPRSIQAYRQEQLIIPKQTIQVRVPTRQRLRPKFQKEVEPVRVIPPIQPYNFKS